jgi:hypothetical protein
MGILSDFVLLLEKVCSYNANRIDGHHLHVAFCGKILGCTLWNCIRHRQFISASMLFGVCALTLFRCSPLNTASKIFSPVFFNKEKEVSVVWWKPQHSFDECRYSVSVDIRFLLLATKQIMVAIDIKIHL